MDNMRKGLGNQAIGFLPILLFIFWDNFLSDVTSFVICLSLSIMCVLFYRILAKDKIYLFSLIPSAITLLVYSFLPILYVVPDEQKHSSLLIELIFVLVLLITIQTRRATIVTVRASRMPPEDKNLLKNNATRFYYITFVFFHLLVAHLIIVFSFILLRGIIADTPFKLFLYRDSGILLGMIILLTEQYYIFQTQNSLNKEIWLPVLDTKGRVSGSIPMSEALDPQKKYFHPIVRIIVMYKGLFYLTKRDRKELVSPDMFDFPVSKYVLFRQSIESAVKESLDNLSKDESLGTRFMLRYTFENEKVKQLVSLYIVNLETEEQQVKFHHGKWWTIKQIEENLRSGIFSEYFTAEFPYLKNTVIFSDRFMKDKEEIETSQSLTNS